jgi:predicted metalloendopeptidase
MTEQAAEAVPQQEEHPTKCPCCNNPWAAATGDFFAKFCQVCETKDPNDDSTSGGGPVGGLDRSNMNFDVLPKDNFYQYANGAWLEKNPIPSGYPNWNSFLTLHVQSQEQLKNILQELSNQDGGDGITDEQVKVAAFYQTAMKEDAIEEAGIKPLEPVLNLCQEIVGNKEDRTKLANGLGTLAFQYGICPFFGIGVSPDAENTDLSIVQIYQGGLGLPDRDYYFDDDKEDKRAEYKKCIALFLTLWPTLYRQQRRWNHPRRPLPPHKKCSTWNILWPKNT